LSEIANWFAELGELAQGLSLGNRAAFMSDGKNDVSGVFSCAETAVSTGVDRHRRFPYHPAAFEA
jgi:hypothetical protein